MPVPSIATSVESSAGTAAGSSFTQMSLNQIGLPSLSRQM